MKKSIIFLFFTLFVVSSAFAELTTVKLKGQVKGLTGKEVVLLDGDRKSELARVTSNGDSFALKANVEMGDGRFYYLYIPALGDLGPSMKIPLVYFFIDSPTLEMNAEIVDGNLKLLSVKGSPTLNEYHALFAKNRFTQEVEAAGIKYNEAFHLYNSKAQTEENMKALKSASENLDKLYKQQIEEFVKIIPQYSKSDALMGIIYSFFYSSPADEVQKLLTTFDKSMQKNYYAKAMSDKINLTKACEVGQPAPDFEVKDLNGNRVKLSSLKGQYVLIDFWASWCGPCRKEIPNLKKVYAEFKDKGLKLVGLSIDDREANWRKAVHEEQLDYLQLWDPQKATMKLYNYNGIPFIVLISPEGIILEKQLRGADVRKKVVQHMLGNQFAIHATLDKPFNGKVYLTCMKERLTKIDSIAVNGNKFSFTGNIDKADVYRVMSRPFGFDASVCVEPGGEYTISILGNRKVEIEVVSGAEQKIINQHKALIKPIEKKSEELSTRYLEAEKKKDAATKESLMEEMSKTFQEKEKATINYLNSIPQSFASVVIASELLLYQYEDLKNIYEKLDTISYANSYYFRSFKKKYLEAADKWIQGKTAIDFTTTDIEGKQVKLSDFKGSYVLLDFWASWCAPCRKKAKELRAIADQLRKKNIVMFAVNMDDKRELWEKATEEDNIDWTNTSELKKFKDNKIAANYKVTQLPTLFLLNPEGVIIKQSPSIEELLKMPDVN